MLGLILYCFAYYFMGGVSMVLGYHRCLTHKAFKLKKGLEYILIFIGLPSGSPIQWVGNHRFHHTHTDEELDPHSPIVHGFWYSHNGWYINSKKPVICFLYSIARPIRILVDVWVRPGTNESHNHLAKDVSDDKFYNFISKPIIFRISLILHVIISFGFAYYAWGIMGLLFLWLTLITISNLGDGVNSMAHKKDDNNSGQTVYNSQLWALFTFGDAFHADHHQQPNSAKLGFDAGKLDLGWKIILILKHLNLAYDIHTFKEVKIEK